MRGAVGDPGTRNCGRSGCRPPGSACPISPRAPSTSRAAREQLRSEIEACILRFEPRFASVNVVLLPGEDSLSASLRLRIEALLHADPAPEPISFDTLVDANTTDVIVTVQDG